MRAEFARVRERRVAGPNSRGERLRPFVCVEQVEEVVEHHREVGFVRGLDSGGDDDLVAVSRRAAREPGKLPPPGGERRVEAGVEGSTRAARGDMQLGSETGPRTPGGDERGWLTLTEGDARVLLGWTTGGHWLVPDD